MKILTSNSKPDIFTKKANYYFLIIGLSLIVVGFVSMYGGKAESPDKFSNAIYSFQQITLAPILIILGYLVQLFGIMHNRK